MFRWMTMRRNFRLSSCRWLRNFLPRRSVRLDFKRVLIPASVKRRVNPNWHVCHMLVIMSVTWLNDCKCLTMCIYVKYLSSLYQKCVKNRKLISLLVVILLMSKQSFFFPPFFLFSEMMIQWLKVQWIGHCSKNSYSQHFFLWLIQCMNQCRAQNKCVSDHWLLLYLGILNNPEDEHLNCCFQARVLNLVLCSRNRFLFISE